MPQKDPLLEFFESQPTQPEPTRPDAVSQMMDALQKVPVASHPEDEDTTKWKRLELASQFGKHIGISVVKGLLDMPSALGDFVAKRNIGALLPPQLQISLEMARTQYPQFAKAQEISRNIVRSGLVSAQRQQELEQAGTLASAERMGAGGINPVTRSLLKHLPDLTVRVPEYAAELAGSIPAAAAMYGGSAAAVGVGAARNLATRTGLHLAASSMATAAQSYLIALRDGESSWMRVVRDLGINAAFEVIGLHGLRNAWRQELGKDAEKLTASIVARSGVDPEVAELKLTQVRAGAGIHDIEVAQAVVDAGKKNPRIAATPLSHQAKKAVAEYWENVVPQNIKVDATLGPAHGVSMDVLVDGQPVVQGFQVHSSKQDPSYFARRTDLIAERIVQLTQEGKSVKIDNVVVSNPGSWSRFVRRLRGEQATYGKMDARALTAFEETLGSAPRGSIAESGVLPQSGTKVSITEPGKPPRLASVLPEAGPEGTVRVQFPATGEIKDVPTAQTRVWLFEKKPPVRLAAHGDGRARAFLVELNAREALLEPVNAGKQDNFFRTPLFKRVDREGDFGNAPRGYVHQDGSLTFSLTKGERLTTYLDSDPALDAGPGDTVRALTTLPLRETHYRSLSERAAHMTSIGDVVDSPRTVEARKDLKTGEVKNVVAIRPQFQRSRPGEAEIGPGRPPGSWGTEPAGKSTAVGGILTRGSKPDFPAGFVPSKQRPDPYAAVPGAPGLRQQVDVSVHPQSRVVASRLQTPEEAPVTARMKHSTPLEATQAEGLHREFRKKAEGIPGTPYSIDRGVNVNDPALVDAQRAARILLETKNVDPKTPVRVMVTDYIHRPEHKAPFTWTLDELAHAEFGLYDFDVLRVAARQRGFRALPNTGEKVVLRDLGTNAEMEFATRLEAANFLSKQPQASFGPKLEARMEAVLKTGWMRGFDPQVDGGDFVSKEAQSVAMDALVQGRRAGVRVWTTPESVLEELTTRARKAPSPQVAGVLEAELQQKSGLGAALIQLNRKLGLPSGTLRYLDLQKVQGDKAQAVLYNRNAVTQLIQAYGKRAVQLLKLDDSDLVTPERFLQALSRREAGLDLISATDPESALAYAYFKNTAQREMMLMGKPVKDEATGRFFRVYPEEIKKAVGQLQGEQLLDPEDFAAQTELQDVIRIPEEVSDVVQGGPPSKLPPSAETPDPPTSDPVVMKIRHGLASLLQTRMRLFKQWEADTGIPFYSSYSDIEQSRDAATLTQMHFRKFLDSARAKVLRRGDRTDVQMLVEARLTENLDSWNTLAKKVTPKLVKVAEETAAQWKKFLGEIGFTEDEIRASFNHFTAIRKKGGDFRAYAGATPALPRMLTFLRRQLEMENGRLTLDERETDFYKLGVRIARMLAFEKHLTNPWNDVAKKMEKAAQASSLPPHYFDNFRAYMTEVMHSPDNFQVASAYTIKLAVQKLDQMVKKASFGKVDLGFSHADHELVDFVGALSSLGYASNLAWNPATIVQQYMQTLQTTLPWLGPKFTALGMKDAVRWLRDPKMQEDMARRGIAGRATTAQPLSLLDDFIHSRGAASSGTLWALNRFVEKGTHAFQVGDDFNRVLAYMGRFRSITELAPKYKTGKIPWAQFVESTGLDLQDSINGPLMRMIKNEIDANNVLGAAHRAADDFQRTTQFVYNRGNNPKVLDGTLGRLFGQYGTWPMGFMNYLWQTATIGEKKLTWNKIKAFATMVGVNAAFTAAMAEVFDADVSRWNVWNAVWYRGGPYADIAAELRYVVTAPEDDAVSQIYRVRLMRQLGSQVVPGIAAFRRYGNAAAELIEKGDVQGASRQLLGLQPRTGGPIASGLE